MSEMAQKGAQLDEGTLTCTICLDPLKVPVTIPCGHSYCLKCIEKFWDGACEKNMHSCPLCRESFTQRPVLVKNTTLAGLVDELKKTELRPATAVPCFAGLQDVACDVCTGIKVKAARSCLQCLASYCQKHLEPHHEAAPLRRHKLVEPCKNLQENICIRHNEVMKMFCRTDQRCICYLCSVEAHKSHDTISAAVERAARQREHEKSQKIIRQGVQGRENDVKVLQEEVEALNRSAEKTVKDSEKMFTELIRLIQIMDCEVKQQIRFQLETEVSRVIKLQEKLEQEISDLKRKDAELEKLSLTEDHNQFLRSCHSVSQLTGLTNSPAIKIHPRSYFKDVMGPLSALERQVQDLLRETGTNISSLVTEVDVLLSDPKAEPKTRAGFLKYSQDIRLDPNTAHSMVRLSEEDRAAELMTKEQPCSGHPARFTRFYQVLSRKHLAGRCYLEVKWRGGGVWVGVAYNNIRRTGSGNECGFGFNDKSWALHCEQNSYKVWNKNHWTQVLGPKSCRIGVYLDQEAGVLSFYSVTHTMTLLHRVQTTFTQPLYVGLKFTHYQAFAEFCETGLAKQPARAPTLAEEWQTYMCGPI